MANEKLTHEEQLHQTEMGQRIKVERADRTNSEIIDSAGEALRSIGRALGASDPAAKHCRYMGSAAVHIYQSEMLGQVMFFSQASTLGDCPEPTASDSVTDLRKSMQRHYGRNPGKKRSGW